MAKKIKPDHELEQTKIKLLRQENKLGFLKNMIKANERRIEILKAESGVLIESLEDTLISQRIHETQYLDRIKELHKYMDKMLDLQQPKRKAKPKKTAKKTKKKKKSKAELLAEKQAEFEAEMARIKAEEEVETEIEPEPEGEEPSQIPTTT